MTTMSLLQMSLTGAVLIAAIVIVRALALNKLPKRTFLVLWVLAAARLLVPVSIPSVLSVWTLVRPLQAAETAISAVGPAVQAVPVPAAPSVAAAPPVQTAPSAVVPAAAGGMEFPVWTAVWLAGVCLCAAFFVVSCLRCRHLFRSAVPVEEETVRTWLAERPLGRRVQVLQCGKDIGPMTYGILRPVILLPKNTDWSDTERLRYVLEHELVHIRRLDGVLKLVLAAAACVHWFNPLAWAMLVLANRDIELSCDEAVVRRFGIDRRSAYAMTLIDLEAQKSGLGPFASAFSRNNMEERITSIMKLKKTSLLAIVLAAVLVCCLGTAFATSAAELKFNSDPPRPQVEDGSFTEAELDRLASLWFDGYGSMTIAEYQEKMWQERDNPEDMELIERYGLNKVFADYPDDPEASKKANAFDRYMQYVYAPLTAELWQSRSFPAANTEAYWTYTFTILDRDLSVAIYEVLHTRLKQALSGATSKEQADAIAAGLSGEQLKVEIPFFARFEDVEHGDDELYAQSSNESATQWDRQLAPYEAFGLSYTYDDPDHDGNGLTMWFEGKEVRGIFDEQNGIWITEHAGSGFSDGAVELYTVYTNGVLSGLRVATDEEQAAFDADRERNTASLQNGEEAREFPQATRADYDSLLALREVDSGAGLPEYASAPYRNYQDLSLEDFNQRLLDWANENQDAWDRINCDVIWDDYAVELTEEEKSFVSLTCWLSGTENGQMVRALYTGGEAADPGFAMQMPMWQTVENSITTAWCDLYYDLSYHVSDPAAVTVRERDACAAAMMNAVSNFWQDTPMDDLLAMTEEEVVERFNAWAAECGTEHVSFHHVTGDHIHFECADERHLAEEHHVETHHTEHHTGHHS